MTDATAREPSRGRKRRRIALAILGSLALAVAIQGEQDLLVKQSYGRRLAAELPHAQLKLLYGGHMQPYVHPAAVAAAVERLSVPPPRQARGAR